MKSRQIFFSALTLSFLAVGMAGCGGGGGGSSGTPPAVSTTPTVVISSSNAPAVAGAAVEAAVGAAALPIGAATSTPSGNGSNAALLPTIGKIVSSSATTFNNQSQTPAIVTGVVYTNNCFVSGTYSLSIDASGTSGTGTFSNCVDVAGESQSGTIIFSNMIVDASGNLSGHEVLNLTITMSSPFPAETVTIVGDISFAYTATTMHMYGNSLTYTSSLTGARTMVNYDLVIDTVTGAIISESFSFNSATLGVATVTITTPFTYGTGLYPNGGVAIVTGANSTKLRITVLGDENSAVGTQVQLELSTDGGTIYGAPTFVNWTSLYTAI